MYISYNWLKRYLPELDKISIEDLSKKITNSLAEVEQVEPKGEELSGIVVGEILETRPHKSSEKLMVANVDMGERFGKKDIVFAAINSEYVQPGTKYPVCTVGGSAYKFDAKGNRTVIQIEQKEVDGEVSNGMLCSAREIGISDETEGKPCVPQTALNGEDLDHILKDFILEIENKSLTHRPDCFSHRGIAREISAMFRIKFNDLDLPETLNKQTDSQFKIKVTDKDKCRRFSAITMDNLEFKVSPFWMQTLLAYIGARPINIVVDISNFVMFDIGYPNHIYDRDAIETNELFVRQANQNEEFEALNEKKYQLSSDMTVITNGKKIDNLAGVIGGADSEVSEKTKNIVIESASWNMFDIRRTMMTTGVQTDAGVRFSKGLDSVGTIDAIKYLVQLLEDLTFAEISSDIIDIDNEQAENREIEFDYGFVKQLIGLNIEREEVTSILNYLNIELLEEVSQDKSINAVAKLKIPSYRMDLNTPQDIVEEITRIYGYEHVEPTLPERDLKASVINPVSELIREIRAKFLATGLDELYTYAFTNPDLQAKCGIDIDELVRLKNPISPELAVFRNTIVPSLLEKIELNKGLEAFEISRVALKTKDEEGVQLQPRRIGAVIGQKGTNSYDFGAIRSKIDFVLTDLGISDIKFENLNTTTNKPKTIPTSVYLPGVSAVVLDKNNNILGICGVLSPIVSEKIGLENYNVLIAELDFDQIQKSIAAEPEFEYKPFGNSQDISRDLSIWVSETTEVGELMSAISGAEIDFFRNIEFIDEFINENAKKEGEKRALTLRINLSNPDVSNSLTDNQISEIMAKVEDVLKNKEVTIR